MIDDPDKAQLLDALAEFLMTEIKPVITDARLSFRVLIAANLAAVAAREVRGEDEADAAELVRLQTLLPEVQVAAVADRPSLQAAIRALSRELAKRVRDGTLDGTQQWNARQALLASLKARLAVDNPFFDTRLDIE